MTDSDFIARVRHVKGCGVTLDDAAEIVRMIVDGDLRHVDDMDFRRQMARAHPLDASADYREAAE